LDNTDVWVRFEEAVDDGTAAASAAVGTIVDAAVASQEDVLVEDASTTYVATAVVERIEHYVAKKERAAGHLSEMVDQALLLDKREWASQEDQPQ
jgi:hypothetical protein